MSQETRPGSPGFDPEISIESKERKEFSNKIIVITGASHPNGIGAATAREFARQGAEAIIITSRQESQVLASHVVYELAELGTKALWLAGDITHEDTPKNIVQTVKRTYDRVDVVVNNAGITRDKPVTAMSTNDWDIVQHTDLRAAFLISKEAVNAFPRSEGGAIVNVGSIVGMYGNAGQENYAAAKAGLIGLTRALTQDLSRRNIRVNTVFPGFVETDLTSDTNPSIKEAVSAATPLGRFGKPEEIAHVIVFLASSKASFVTGQTIEVDGGLNGGIIAIPGMLRAGYRKMEKT